MTKKNKKRLASVVEEMSLKQKEIERLLVESKARLPELKLLLSQVSDHWNYEDPVYRFYHQSFKVYHIQSNTQNIVKALRRLAPHLKLNSDFEQIVAEGTDKEFDISHNMNWLHETRPMLEAFFHTRHMLEMVCKYAEELDKPPQILPSGWATVLYLFNLR